MQAIKTPFNAVFPFLLWVLLVIVSIVRKVVAMRSANAARENFDHHVPEVMVNVWLPII